MTDPSAAPDDQSAAPSTSPTTEPKPRGFFRRHWLATILTVLIATPALVFTVWAGIALSFSYSEGTRTGFVQKISKKGWVCKTWEGEMAMTAQPGVAPVLFLFTVRSDSVAGAITAAAGKQVTLTYEEHQGVPSSCFGETGYFVTGVQLVNR
ncbi:MAG: hypothetical protein P3A28_04230 [Gemmatimonadota bacterium]|nr:hypothetical protein [Gemmatimonadota bacterium]